MKEGPRGYTQVAVAEAPERLAIKLPFVRDVVIEALEVVAERTRVRPGLGPGCVVRRMPSVVHPYLDAQTPVARHDEQPVASGAKSGGSAGPPYRPLRPASLRPVRRPLRKNHASEYRPVPTGTRTPLSRLSAMTETAKTAKDRALWLDVTGHGLLSRFHDGCRCPWCTSRARERQCLCPDCLAVRTTGVYFAPAAVRTTQKPVRNG